MADRRQELTLIRVSDDRPNVLFERTVASLFVVSDNRRMAGLSDIVKLLPTLSPGERAEVLKLVVQQMSGAFPGIDSRPEVCGGEPCIVRTRIPVWLLEQARRLGASEQALLAAYPTLRAEDLVNAWAYVQSHSSEIEAQIRENEAA